MTVVFEKAFFFNLSRQALLLNGTKGTFRQVNESKSFVLGAMC